MQCYLSTISMISSGIILFSIIICFLLCMIQLRSANKGLLECIQCKDSVINEFSKIRHDYNNILQTITCLTEEEDIEGLKEYKNVILEKANSLNKNSIAQLAKIKDQHLLRAVYKLHLNSETEGFVLSIVIYNNIIIQKPFKSEYYNLLKECLERAYQSGEKEINLNIRSNERGISFSFDNALKAETFNFSTTRIKARKKLSNNNVVCNISIKNARLFQEILIPLEH